LGFGRYQVQDWDMMTFDKERKKESKLKEKPLLNNLNLISPNTFRQFPALGPNIGRKTPAFFTLNVRE